MRYRWFKLTIIILIINLERSITMQYIYYSRFTSDDLTVADEILRDTRQESLNKYLANILYNLLHWHGHDNLAFNALNANQRKLRNQILKSVTMLNKSYPNVQLTKSLTKIEQTDLLREYTQLLGQYYFNLNAIFDYAIMQILHGQTDKFTIPFSREQQTAMITFVAVKRLNLIRQRTADNK